MNTSKPNDWFLAITENPTFSLSDFESVGLTTENTALQSKDVYRNSNYVKEIFTDDQGKFDEVSFNKHYDAVAQAYNIYANDQYEKDVLTDIEWDPYNAWRPNGAKVKQPGFKVVQEVNPLHQAKGFGGIGSISNPTITAYEAAQQQKVQDWKTKEFLDYSPNDRSLENSIIGFVKSIAEPLVMATYEETGTHKDPFTGRLVQHQKGEYKINDQGEYYYETLSGRSAYGKEVKSVFDSLTVDGSAANSYDFFDSDGLDKSVTGTIAKTVAVVAPLFTPIAPYYGYAMLGVQLLDLLPTLYNTTIGNFVETPEFLNQMQGLGRSFRGNTTQYSKEHLLSAENFFTIVSDVALQWQQQMTVAKLYNKVVGTDKKVAKISKEIEERAFNHAKKKGLIQSLEAGDLSEETVKKSVIANLPSSNKAAKEILSKTKLQPLLEANNKMASNYSMGYMAMMQGFQMYEDALAIGTSKGEAALLTWGTIIGMGAIMKTGLGELFNSSLQNADQVAFKKAINTLQSEISKGYQAVKSIPNKTTKTFKLLDIGKKAGQKFWEGVREHSLSFAGKTFGEGIEEVSEELVMDFFKVTHNILADLGVASTEQKFDFEDWHKRYLMSFAGGAIGGAVFGLSDMVNSIKAPKDVNQELTYLLRNGKKSEILNELDTFRKKGKLGNTFLSTRFTTDSETGDPYYETAINDKDTQNEANYKVLKTYIESIDKTIHQEKLDFTDEQILDKLINADRRLSQIQSVVGKDGINGRFLQRFNNITEDILNKEQEIQRYIDSVKDTDKRNDPSFEENLENLKKEKQELLKERDAFFSQENILEYTDKLLFEVNNNVNAPYYTANAQQYIEAVSGKKISDLNEKELQKYIEKYEIFKQASIDTKFNEAYIIYKKLNKELTSEVNDQSFTYDRYGQLIELVKENLVDREATKQKFKRKSDINEYQQYEGTGIHELAHTEYMFPDKPQITGNTQQDIQAQQEYNDQVSEISRNYYELIEKFEDVGFIDSNAKQIILNGFGNIAQDISQIKDYIFKSIIEQSEGNSFEDKLKNFKITFSDPGGNEQEDNLSKILDQVKSAIDILDGSKESLYQVDNMFFDIPGSDFDAIDDVMETFIMPIHEALRANSKITTYNEVNSRLSVIETNPLYKFIKKLAINLGSAYPDILTLLEEENKKLYKKPLDEYEVNSKILEDIDTSIKLLDIVESLINAADGKPFDDNYIFGHNAVLNSFSQELGKPLEYGIIRSDLAVMMREDLRAIRAKLNYLQDIHKINQANTFMANKKTGDRSIFLLTNILKCKNEYEKLKQIKVGNIGLFDGVDAIDTPVLDSSTIDTIDSKDIYTEHAKITNLIFDNYQKIKSIDANADELITQQIIDIFGAEKLILQDNSRLDQKVSTITDYDAVQYIMAICSYNKSKFDSDILNIIQDSEIKFVPLYPQLHVAYIASAAIKNSNLFNKFVRQLKTEEPEIGCDLIPIENSIIISGCSGVGKTSVVGYIVNRIFKSENKNNTDIVWDSAPTKVQTDNLVSNISANNSFTFDELLEHIIGKDTLDTLNKDLEDITKSSELYSCEFKEVGDVKASVYTINKDKFTFNEQNPPKVIFIDEYSFLNTIYSQIITTYAKKVGAKIVFIGDNRQSGYRNEVKDGDKVYALAGPSKNAAKGNRTPELNVSMRPANIHKKGNNELYERLTRIWADFIYGKSDIEEAKKSIDQIVSEGVLNFYEGNESILAGDKIIDNISKDYLINVIKNSESFAYVYDDLSSPTYTLLNDILTENPELKSKVSLYTQKEVQGNEAQYALVDVSFENDNIHEEKTAQKINTLFTRGTEGSLIINKGLTSKFKVKNKQSTYYARTPNMLEVLDSYKKYLNDILMSTSQLYSGNAQNNAPSQSNASSQNNTSNQNNTPTQNSSSNQNNASTQVAPLQVNNQDNLSKQIEDLKNQIYPELLKYKSIVQSLDNAELNKLYNLLWYLYDFAGVINFQEDLDSLISEYNTTFQNFLNKLNDLNPPQNQNQNQNQNQQQFINFVQALSDDIQLLFDASIISKQEQDQLNIKVKNATNLEQANEVKKEIEDKKPQVKEPNSEKTEKIVAATIQDDISPIENTDITPTVRAYGYYKRKGNSEFEDYGIFSNLGLSNEDIVDRLDNFREFFLQGGNPRNDGDLKHLMSVIQRTTDTDLNNALKNGWFEIIVSKFDQDADMGRRNVAQDPNKFPDHLFRLAYSWELDGKIYNITLGQLGDPQSWLSGIAQYKESNKKDAEAKAQAYKDWYNDIKRRVDSEGTLRFKLEDYQVESSKYARIFPLTKHYNLKDFDINNKGAISSPIYLFSGDEKRLERIFNSLRNKGIEQDIKDWKGKTIMFSSPFKYVKVKGTFFDGEKSITDGWVQVTSNNIENLYYHMLEQGQDAAIRALRLDPEGMFAIDQWDTKGDGSDARLHGFLHMDFMKESEKGSRSKKLSLVGGETTGLRMLVSFWNLRGDLKQVIKAIDDYCTENNITRDHFQYDSKFIQYFKNKFPHCRLMPSKDVFRQDYDQRTSKIFVSYESAELQIRIIDDILKHCNISYVENLYQEDRIQLRNDLKINDDLFQKTIQRKPLRLIETKKDDNDDEVSTIYTVNPYEDVNVNLGSTFGTQETYNLVYLLSAIHGYYATQQDNPTKSEITIKSNFSNHEDLFYLKDLISDYDISRLSSDYTRAKFIRNLLSVAFHGVIDPYAGKGNNRTKYEPIENTLFPYGIFYHTRYRLTQDKTSYENDYYPIRTFDDDIQDTRSRFRIKSLIQLPYMRILPDNDGNYPTSPLVHIVQEKNDSDYNIKYEVAEDNPLDVNQDQDSDLYSNDDSFLDATIGNQEATSNNVAFTEEPQQQEIQQESMLSDVDLDNLADLYYLVEQPTEQMKNNANSISNKTDCPS